MDMTGVTLCDQCTARDTVADVPESWIPVEHLGRGCLVMSVCLELVIMLSTCLGVAAAFEQWRNPNKADVVVPHHAMDLLLPRKLEDVVKH